MTLVRYRLPNGEVWERRGLAWALVCAENNWDGNAEDLVVIDADWPEYVETAYGHWRASGRLDQSNGPLWEKDKKGQVHIRHAMKPLSMTRKAIAERARRALNREAINARHRENYARRKARGVPPPDSQKGSAP